jgi:hypothetical protein
VKDAASLLLRLKDAAETDVTKPLLTRIDDLAALHIDLQEASPMTPDPAGGLLIDDEALLLAQVLGLAAKQRRNGDARRAALLQQLAGVLLPAVRQAASRAIEVRRDTRATP